MFQNLLVLIEKLPITEILFFILGASLSKYYYKKANEDQKYEFKKVHLEFKKKAIQKIKEEIGNKSNISIILSDLWKEVERKHGKEFLSSRCPRCGGDRIQDVSITNEPDREYSFGVCEECGFEF